MLVLGAVFSLGHPALSARIEGVRFVERHTVDGAKLRIVGHGLQRYMVFYKVCVAAFYLPKGTPAHRALTDVPRRLEIEYFHKIRADQFAELTRKGVRKNCSEQQFRAVRGRLAQINKLYRDVKPGDRYSLTYLPEKGTVLALNGADQGTIKGADFAQAIFSVWLGEKPLSSALKTALLGQM